MQTVTIQQAKIQLSQLIDIVLNDEEVIITKTGKPIIKLIPVNQPQPRKFGVLKGKIEISEDFDAPFIFLE